MLKPNEIYKEVIAKSKDIPWFRFMKERFSERSLDLEALKKKKKMKELRNGW